MPERDVTALAIQLDQISREHNRFADKQDALRTDVDRIDRALAVHDEQISGAGGLVKAMETLGEKVDSLNKALWAFAASFIVAAITIVLALH